MATFFSASADHRDLAGGGDMSFHHYTTSNPYSDSPTGGGMMPFPATIVSEGHVAHAGDGRDEPASFVNARDGPASSAEMGLQTQLLMANASAAAQHQGLSLSLGTQGVPVSLYQYRQAGMGGAAALLSPSQCQTTASRNAQSIYIQNSKYLKAARELLDEVVNVRDAIKRQAGEKSQSKDSGEGKDAEKSEEKAADEHEGNSSAAELTPSERQDLQNKVSALMALLDQVDRKYRHYRHQMQMVMSSFDAVAGAGAARPYTALALQTISRHFRSLRDAIGLQVQSLRRSLGEKDTSAQGGGLSRLRYIDQQLRQQRAMQQFGMMQQPQHAWRPQRGLPESAVSVLRAWLFEHFLHPYPKDSEKLMLARQTGLSRGQVSNWFINARVRLWKPMIEEMYRDGQRRRRRRSKRRRGFRSPPIEEAASEGEQPRGEVGGDAAAAFRVPDLRSTAETVCESSEAERSAASCVTYVGVELRQRSVSGSARVVAASVEDGVSSCGSSTRESAAAAAVAADVAAAAWRPEANGGVKKKLEKEESLDWEKYMKENSNILGEVECLDNSPFRYFLGELYGGNALRSTISVGNEKKRQRVYNTMFHVPWRCERLIVAGFFVCLDSFLSLLTIMPARIVVTIWRVLKTRKFRRPNAADLSDYGCFVVLALGVASLQMIDISLIYHVIRGQGTIKLYVVYNVLEIFDKLCQSFGEDVLQVLFNSAEGLSACSTDNVTFELMRFVLDEAIAVLAFVVHSFVLLAQAITLSTCIIAHNNALLALLVSNNFAEIKSNVFKRVSKENLHNLVYYDIIERFHITAFLLFVLAQNILEAEGPWFDSFLTNASLVFLCEVLIDAIKHSFLAKFNEIKPVAYSEFLEDLCKQILNDKPDDRQKDLTFIPLAPACVVIRVLTPVYATLLPAGPFIWRIFWILLWSILTYFMLAIFKILVGLILRCLANWYVNLRLTRKQHVD